LLQRSLPLQAAIDTQQFFAKPDAAANFGYWANMASWTLDQAVALLFSKAPEVVDWERIGPHLGTSCFATRYARLRDLVLREKALNQLTDPVRPAVFLRLALENGIDVPTELVEQVEARGIVVDAWKNRYKKLQKRHIHENAAKDEQIAALIHEVDELHAHVKEVESHKIADAPLRKNERNSLEKKILGMAIDKYDYDPHSDRNSATGGNRGSIAAALDRCGLSIESDTVRRHLQNTSDRYQGAPRIPTKN
jgi:hypothetical protein